MKRWTLSHYERRGGDRSKKLTVIVLHSLGGVWRFEESAVTGAVASACQWTHCIVPRDRVKESVKKKMPTEPPVFASDFISIVVSSFRGGCCCLVSILKLHLAQGGKNCRSGLVRTNTLVTRGVGRKSSPLLEAIHSVQGVEELPIGVGPDKYTRYKGCGS